MKHKILLLLFLLIVFVLPVVINSTSSRGGNSENTVKNTIDNLSEQFVDLTYEEYEEVKDEFFAFINNKDPKAALIELRERIKTDSALLRACHALVHDIGHEAYEKYGDFAEAMSYQDEICNSGYLHGVIESHFWESEDILAAAKTVCDRYPLGSYLSWECQHGIGHGLMFYTENDLPQSLILCDAYESEAARSNCSNGVFMENFNTNQKLHPSEYLKEDDQFYPCREQFTRHKLNCYLYAPTYYLSLHKDDYVGALQWCGGAEIGYRAECARGVGAQAMKENIDKPKFIESICMNNKNAHAESCVRGMVDVYINHFGSLQPATILCAQLEPSNRKTCYQVVGSMVLMFAQ